MLSLAFLNPILVHVFTNQLLLISIMGKCSKEFRSMKNRSNCIFKSFLIVLLIISIVHMSESNVELQDATENTNLIETENLQSNEEKTEEPLKIMNQIAYFQGTEKSVAIQQANEIVPAGLSELNSNSLLSFMPETVHLASDDDDNEQNDAQESFLVADPGIKRNTKLLVNGDSMRPMIKLLRGNRMLLKQPLISNSKRSLVGEKMKTLVEDPAKTKKLYLSEVERIRGYLPSLMKLKRLVKKCQCSYSDEDQYSSIKDAIMPIGNRVDHRINLDYVDDEEPDDDEKDEDDDSQPSDILRQRGFNKYKRFDLNQNLRDDDDLDEEDEFEKFNEPKNEEDKNTEENSSDPFEKDRESSEESSSEESIEEYEESDENLLKEEQDQQWNSSAYNPENNDFENSKLLSPFMAKNFEANMSPTSSSDIIFNELGSMQANQMDEQENAENENEIQLAKLKKANGNDASMTTTNNSNLVNSNSLEAAAGTLSMQGRGGSRGSRGRGGKRNLFDHWILIRKRRQVNRLNQKKGSSKGGRNFF